MLGLRGRKMILQKARQAALAFGKMAASRPLAGACETKNLVWMLTFGQRQDFRCRCNRMFEVADDGKIPAVIHNSEDGALRRIRAGTRASQRFLVRIHLGYSSKPTIKSSSKIIPNLGLDCGYISSHAYCQPQSRYRFSVLWLAKNLYLSAFPHAHSGSCPCSRKALPPVIDRSATRTGQTSR